MELPVARRQAGPGDCVCLCAQPLNLLPHLISLIDWRAAIALELCGLLSLQCCHESLRRCIAVLVNKGSSVGQSIKCVRTSAVSRHNACCKLLQAVP